MHGNFQVTCGSMVGENRWSPASIETPGKESFLYDSTTFFLNTFLVEILIDVLPNTKTILMPHKHNC